MRATFEQLNFGLTKADEKYFCATKQVSNKGAQMIRYYGCLYNQSRLHGSKAIFNSKSVEINRKAFLKISIIL